MLENISYEIPPKTAEESKVLVLKLKMLTEVKLCRAGDGEVASDPNSITVGGDIKMNLDLNEAIEEDVKLSEEETNLN